jgi:hypothetical protein
MDARPLGLLAAAILTPFVLLSAGDSIRIGLFGTRFEGTVSHIESRNDCCTHWSGSYYNFFFPSARLCGRFSRGSSFKCTVFSSIVEVDHLRGFKQKFEVDGGWVENHSQPISKARHAIGAKVEIVKGSRSNETFENKLVYVWRRTLVLLFFFVVSLAIAFVSPKERNH